MKTHRFSRSSFVSFLSIRGNASLHKHKELHYRSVERFTSILSLFYSFYSQPWVPELLEGLEDQEDQQVQDGPDLQEHHLGPASPQIPENTLQKMKTRTSFITYNRNYWARLRDVTQKPPGPCSPFAPCGPPWPWKSHTISHRHSSVWLCVYLCTQLSI